MTPTELQDNSTPTSDTIGDLALEVIGGTGEGTLHLSGLKGRTVVLFILGIDCGTCKHLAKLLSSLHFEYAPDVSFIGVCIQNGSQERISEFEQAVQVPFPITFCTNRELCAALDIPRSTWLFFPTIIFIDRHQVRRGIHVGGSEFFNDAATSVREALDSLLLDASSMAREMGADV